MSRDVRARIWPTHGSPAEHPERAHPGVTPPARTGVCFSGGSTRSYAATIGQLRGLTETGLIEQVGYISAVSGGAWAATAYTFYPVPAGSQGDRDILGSHVGPEGLFLDRLALLEYPALGVAATGDFARALADAQADGAVLHDEVWTRAIAETFLRPFGLDDPERPAGFTLDEHTASEIRERNPGWADLRLHMARQGVYRPYLLIHTALNWPEDVPDLRQTNLVGFEYSPLGIGAGPRLALRYHDRPPRTVGGGFVEPIGFDTGAPDSTVDTDRFVVVRTPRRPFSLADAVSASSAFSTPDRDLSVYPHATYWPVGPVAEGGQAETTREVFTDGGDIENYGLLPLLRRQVHAVIVFINSVWPLSLAHDPTRWPADLNEAHPSSREIDPFIAPLFGAPSTRFRHNRVFAEEGYGRVVSGLQRAKRAGEPVMVTTTHRVVANEWWGIEGGFDVNVCWVYNEHVERWVKDLPEPVQRHVREGKTTDRTGPFAHFPHYLTRGQNPDALIRLTAAQVNLLAHLSSWNIIERQDDLRELLRSV